MQGLKGGQNQDQTQNKQTNTTGEENILHRNLDWNSGKLYKYLKFICFQVLLKMDLEESEEAGGYCGNPAAMLTHYIGPQLSEVTETGVGVDSEMLWKAAAKPSQIMALSCP